MLELRSPGLVVQLPNTIRTANPFIRDFRCRSTYECEHPIGCGASIEGVFGPCQITSNPNAKILLFCCYCAEGFVFDGVGEFGGNLFPGNSLTHAFSLIEYKFRRSQPLLEIIKITLNRGTVYVRIDTLE